MTQLPPFIVEETIGPSWRYSQIPRFEILARCDDSTTRRLVGEFDHASLQLGMILPDRFQSKRDGANTLILYDQKLWPVTAQNAVAAMLGFMPLVQPEASATKSNDPEKSPLDVLFDRTPQEKAATIPKRFFGNIALADVDSQTIFAIVSDISILPQETFLTPMYVEGLLGGCVPELPSWFKTGFLRLYGSVEFRGDVLVLRPMKGESSPKSSLNSAGAARVDEPLPLNDLFADHDVEGIDPGSRLTQAELFVRWGIDPAGEKRVEQFWTFVARSGSEAITEKVFQECFGLSFNEANQQLAAFGANAQTTRWKLARSKTSPPSMQLRDATPGEIARIKGEWERLEIRYIRKRIPEVEGTYLAEARRVFQRAIDRGDQDPRLLASFGLLELEADNKPLAREYLEGAVKQAVVRPRAYFELARLRCEYFLARSTRDDGKLNAEQMNTVIELLLLATRQSPSLPEVYELLAEVCVNSFVPPPPAVLAAIEEGVKLFPKNRDLADLVAKLHSDDKDSSQTMTKRRPTLQDAINASLRDRLLEETKGHLSR